jgi:hypothetical protein
MTSSLFLLDYFHCDLILPYEVMPHFVLRRANTDEKKLLVHYLKNFSPSIGITDLYEHETNDFKYSEFPLNLSYSTSGKLDESNWNYYLITAENNFEFDRLSKAGFLSSKSISLDLTLFNIGGIGGSASSIFNFFNGNDHLNAWGKAEFNKSNILTKEFIDEIVEIYNLITSLNSRFKIVSDVIQMYSNIKTISGDSYTGQLQFFTIWEILLAHKAIGAGDSLTNQLKNKIPLLHNRMDNKINYISYCVGAEHTKEKVIIEKLYSYRSDIVHGNSIDFADKYKMFKNKENLKGLLYEITKKLILHSLKEPQLILDLKEC